MRWAIVIGIDEYGSGAPQLSAAVADAVRFRDWVVAEGGGNVPPTQLRVLLGRKDPDRRDDDVVPTKDNIVTTINEVVTACGDDPECLFFFFAGHGITARVSNRDEDALVTPGFDEIHPDHSLALRSLTEHFETTPFKDQFFFIDACRDTPWTDREFEIGRWPIPRKRDPGKPPVQQFILKATSPGLTATEVGWPGEAIGAFTDVLMSGLAGLERAKAWSWDRNCYEVRWERLAAYVNEVMAERQHPTEPPPGMPAAGWPIQIPQDAGSRGVAGRDRDALLVSYPQAHFPRLNLTLELEGEPAAEEAEVSVLDAIGQPVVSALKVAGMSQTFTLPPKTYAVRATTTDDRVGVLKAPIDLYADNQKAPVPLRPRDAPPPGEVEEAIGPDELARAGQTAPPGTIEITSRDPLAVAEICDEAGQVLAVTRRDEQAELSPGFYRVRHVGPESPGEAQFVVLSAGEHERVPVEAPPPPQHVADLADVLGVAAPAWAQPSTVVAAAVGEALNGGEQAQRGLGLQDGPGNSARVAFFAVAGDGDDARLADLSVRIWRAGDGIPAEATTLAPARSGVAAVVESDEASWEQAWLALEPEREDPMVAALPVLPDRLATVVAQVDSDRVRLYQFHPQAGRHASSSRERLLQVELLQRLLLSGRLDGAEPLTRELVDGAAEDAFAGCVAGYVLLRLGRHEKLGDLASRVAVAAPKLSDAYILRGEHEAGAGKQEAANQAFADAVGAGIPAFGEGLTRLVEGLRASAFVHPRGALVRHIFQRHARGSMWAAFVPRRPLEPGGLVISGADIGFEG